MKERYNNLALYRIVATIMILQFHIFFICYPENVFGTIYLSKFVQGLTALSGFLLSQKVITNVGKFYLNRLSKIIFPALVVIGLVTIWNVIFMFISNNYDFPSMFYGTRAYNGGLLIQFGNYYFLGYIFFCYLITPLLQKSKWLGLLIFLVVAFIETSITKWMDPLYIVSCYIIGYYIGKFSYSQFVGKCKSIDIVNFVIYGVISAFLIIFSLYFTREGEAIIGSTSNRILTNVMMSLFGVTSMMVILVLFKFTNYIRPIRFDKYSYIIFLFNQIFMVGATNVAYLAPEFWMKNLIVYLLVIVSGVAIRSGYDTYKLIKNRKKGATT